MFIVVIDRDITGLAKFAKASAVLAIGNHGDARRRRPVRVKLSARA
jgi:hypothetical protein